MVEGGRASFKPALLFMCICTGLAAGVCWVDPRLWPHVTLQLLALVAWAVVYGKMLSQLISGEDERKASQLNYAQTLIYVLWLEDCAWTLDTRLPAVGTAFLLVVTIGYAFNTATYFYDDTRFLRSMLASVLGFAILVGLAGLLTVPVGDSPLGHPTVAFIGKNVLVTGLMAMVFSMHGGAHRELTRRMTALNARATRTALARQEREIASRTANLLGVGAGAGLFSHDVAGPITVLTLAAEELRESASPDQLEVLDTLVAASADIRLLSSDLVFALRGGHHPREVSEVIDLVRRHLKFRQNQLPHGLRLEHQCDPATIVVDSLFTQAVANLVANGARFSPEGRVQIRGEVLEDGAYRMVVRDWGVEGEQREVALKRMREALSSEGGVEADQDESHGLSRGVGLWLVGAAVRRLGARLELGPPAEGPGIRVALWIAPPAPESAAS